MFSQGNEFSGKCVISVHVNTRYIKFAVREFDRAGSRVAVGELSLEEELVFNIVRYSERGPGVSFIWHWVIEGFAVAGEVCGFTVDAVGFLDECYVGRIIVKLNIVIELGGGVGRAV